MGHQRDGTRLPGLDQRSRAPLAKGARCRSENGGTRRWKDVVDAPRQRTFRRMDRGERRQSSRPEPCLRELTSPPGAADEERQTEKGRQASRSRTLLLAWYTVFLRVPRDSLMQADRVFPTGGAHFFSSRSSLPEPSVLAHVSGLADDFDLSQSRLTDIRLFDTLGSLARAPLLRLSVRSPPQVLLLRPPLFGNGGAETNRSRSPIPFPLRSA